MTYVSTAVHSGETRVSQRSRRSASNRINAAPCAAGATVGAAQIAGFLRREEPNSPPSFGASAGVNDDVFGKHSVASRQRSGATIRAVSTPDGDSRNDFAGRLLNRW